MVAGLVIEAFDSLPADVSVLLDAARAEGHSLVQRLVDEWEDGSNRFDHAGEVALEARLGSGLVAIGGLNVDPYIDDPSVGRIRHVYVVPKARDAGVGRSLVRALVDHARTVFSRVRLRTVTPDGTAFYIALGFEVLTSEDDATHQIVF